VTVQAVTEKLFAALPMDEAMAILCPTTFRTEAVLVREHESILESHPEILAGLWLYVDDIERAHTIAQSLDAPTGSWWHAIVHRREGDFWNSKYWYRRVGAHPAMPAGFEPNRFVDQVEANPDDPDLAAVQRTEWKALFDWCVNQDSIR